MDKKLDRVALTISLQGIRMVNIATGDAHLEFSIYRFNGQILKKNSFQVEGNEESKHMGFGIIYAIAFCVPFLAINIRCEFFQVGVLSY